MGVTGSEPQVQAQCFDLLIRLCDRGYAVCLETGGAMDIGKVDSRVCRVVAVRTPAPAKSSEIAGRISRCVGNGMR